MLVSLLEGSLLLSKQHFKSKRYAPSTAKARKLSQEFMGKEMPGDAPGRVARLEGHRPQTFWL